MRAILLAAGKGTRISKSIPNIPKSTVDVGGTPLIIRTIHMLKKKNISVTVVTGYQHKVIDELVEKNQIDVNIVYNPFFDVTNSIGSLWMAKDYIIEDDTIIANADVFWEEDILNQILEEEKELFMISDKARADDGDYFFMEEQGRIIKYGKELARNERNCEYVGIAYIGKKYIKSFREKLISMIEVQRHDCWWENVLYDMIDKGEMQIECIDVNGKFWAEVDFIEDYYRILEYVKNIGENI